MNELFSILKYFKNITLKQNPKDPELIDIHGDVMCKNPGHSCVVKLELDDSSSDKDGEENE